MRTDLYKNRYRIKTSRKENYDYSQDGYYFVTICAKDKEMFFGNISCGKMFFSDIGFAASECWREIPVHFPFVRLDEYVIMPDHVHGIIVINNQTAGVQNPNAGARNAGVQNPNAGARNARVQNPNAGARNVETQNFASLRTRNIETRNIETRNIETRNIVEYKNKFGPQSKNLSSIIRGFKIGVTKFANENMKNFAWQPRFHDRIIRNEDELNAIRQYIVNNSTKWEIDKNIKQ